MTLRHALARFLADKMTRHRMLTLLLLCLMALTFMRGPAWAQPNAPDGCIYVERDPGFERDDAWAFTQTASPGYFDTTEFYAGARSAFVGLHGDLDNQEVDSTVWQRMTLPQAETITASMMVRLQSGDENDRWYMVVWDLATDESTILLYEPGGISDWEEVQLDLSDFAGKEILFVVGVHNDGAGEKAGLWVDEARVLACHLASPTLQPVKLSPTPTATPTPAPTFTPTPLPTDTPTSTPSPTFTATPPPTLTPTPTERPASSPTPTPTTAFLVTPRPPTSRGLPDNSALPLLAAVAFSGMFALIVMIINLRR